MSTTRFNPETLDPAWVGDVIRFWFEEMSESEWFAKSDAIDVQIRDRFLVLHEQLVAQDGLVVATSRLALAIVIVLDQFSRNMFRDHSRTFAADSIARRISRSAIELGFDIAMTRQQRMFLYLPFEHSEDAADQQLSLGLIGHLGDKEWTRYAMEHKTIIDRFGRFPHRNAVLARPSSADEMEFLKDPEK